PFSLRHGNEVSAKKEGFHKVRKKEGGTLLRHEPDDTVASGEGERRGGSPPVEDTPGRLAPRRSLLRFSVTPRPARPWCASWPAANPGRKASGPSRSAPPRRGPE